MEKEKNRTYYVVCKDNKYYTMTALGHIWQSDIMQAYMFTTALRSSAYMLACCCNAKLKKLIVKVGK